MSVKQDRVNARTPADLERKYDLGSMGDRFAEVMGIALDAQTHSEAALDAIGQTNSVVADLSQKVDEISITVKDLDEGTISNLSTRVGVISASVSAIDKNVNSAEFVIGIINKQSTAKISADRLDIAGKTLNIYVDHTHIVGDITADQIDVDDLNALEATIGGWEINEDCISKSVSQDNTDGWTISATIMPPEEVDFGETPTNKIFAVHYEGNEAIDGQTYDPFYVRADGYLHSEYGDIGGWEIRSEGLFYENGDYEAELAPWCILTAYNGSSGETSWLTGINNGRFHIARFGGDATSSAELGIMIVDTGYFTVEVYVNLQNFTIGVRTVTPD